MTEPMRQAEPCIPCVDTWQLDRMDAAVRGAYDALAKRGEINIKKFYAVPSLGLVIVDYVSTLPPDWTRQALKRAKEESIHGKD